MSNSEIRQDLFMGSFPGFFVGFFDALLMQSLDFGSLKDSFLDSLENWNDIAATADEIHRKSTTIGLWIRFDQSFQPVNLLSIDFWYTISNISFEKCRLEKLNWVTELTCTRVCLFCVSNGTNDHCGELYQYSNIQLQSWFEKLHEIKLANWSSLLHFNELIIA